MTRHLQPSRLRKARHERLGFGLPIKRGHSLPTPALHGANASARAMLAGNAANGGTNEAGIVRYRRLVARAKKLGVTLAWGRSGQGFRHEVLSQAEFEAVIGVGSTEAAEWRS